MSETEKKQKPVFVCGEVALSFSGCSYAPGDVVTEDHFGAEIFKRLLKSKAIVNGKAK